MDIKITTLSENTAKYDTLAEWGLSMLVEAEGLRILVDTGRSFTAVHNAQLMGLDLSTIDYIVLSHGHDDHTGGLRDVLRLKGEVEIIAHPDIWSLKYVRRDREAPERYIGIPFSRAELESHGARFNLTEEPAYIAENILTTGEIPMISGYEDIEQNLFVKEEGILHPDLLADDLALVINTNYGLVVVSGCAHRGIVNTIHHAQKLTGQQQVHAVIGGTHLLHASEERLQRTIVDLKEIGLQKLGVSHCTGFHASAKLAQEFEGAFFSNNAGTRLTLP